MISSRVFPGCPCRDMHAILPLVAFSLLALAVTLSGCSREPDSGETPGAPDAGENLDTDTGDLPAVTPGAPTSPDSDSGVMTPAPDAHTVPAPSAEPEPIPQTVPDAAPSAMPRMPDAGILA